MSVISSVLPILTDGEEYKITSPFGYRVDPVTGTGNNAHKGIDLVLWMGAWANVSDIGAAWDGVVVSVRDTVAGFSKSQTAGNFVVIDHGGGFVSKYYHLEHGSAAVAAGDEIRAGQVIGRMGSTGYSTGAHLHFQLERDGVPMDPLPYLTGEKTLTETDADPLEQDNTPAEWAEEAVTWARESGILYGDEHGNLRLHEACTREMMLVFLHRAITGA